VVTRRGYDPRDFVVFAFGGGGPLHAPFYSASIGVKYVYMFPMSAVFSAFGIATSDIQRIFPSFTFLRMTGDNEKIAKLLNAAYRELDRKAFSEMLGCGFKKEEIILIREIRMKFGRQVNMETIDLPVKDYTEEDIDDLGRRFVEYYKKLYGEGSAFVTAGMEIMGQTVIATVKSHAAPPIARALRSADASKALKGERAVYFEKCGDFVSTKIYELTSMEPGNTIKGPAIIEAPTTTFVIPPDYTAIMNEYEYLVVECP
jgi:N-methylhydantoinase A/oxoprolinase/acetone carboxylase beta subunit